RRHPKLTKHPVLSSTPSPQTGVQPLERGGAGAKLRLFKLVQRLLDRGEVVMKIVRLLVDIDEPGRDLAGRGALVQKIDRRDSVVHVMLGRDLAQVDRGAVMQLDH